jgi:hypothetical protein
VPTYPKPPTDGPCIIGKKYRVPCIKLAQDEHCHSLHGRDGWIPIIGPEHEDAEYIGFAHYHYHPDVRFISSRTLLFAGIRASRPRLTAVENVYASVVTTRLQEVNLRTGEKTWRDIKHEIQERVKICRRLPSPAFPWTNWQPELAAKFKDHKLKDCLVCPHRGLPLKPFEDSEGYAVCPGHGLVWNLLERRIATEEEAKAARERAKEQQAE